MKQTTPPRPKRSDPSESLQALQVWRRLVVGPVRLEKRRLIAPYSLQWSKGDDTIELVYRYSEDVFDPEKQQDLNLASMMAAQVALNYGLFCDEIVVHGPLNRIDQRFLVDMANNTAREIYVKKFLEPNKFLIGDMARLPAVRQNKYLHAKLLFPDAVQEKRKGVGREVGWAVEQKRCAVLSSGGKDSLLSYGLLDEVGQEVHPIFINESGRHWFTALNAFRDFEQKIPLTARVWTNCDRVFAWMLRHLPFVRKDFSDLRSDDYPIRLWTVAVFLFGALPVLRRRAVGRLVIGDEYDTTRRLSHQGITHYDGLYDQSRYFDNAMTRYFTRKGWGVMQFSILRPLSEFLIQKMLAHRFPALLLHQVSCHATHKEGQRIHPCGRCEKCRRIVAMLLAADVDPALCGYTADQVSDCLKSLSSQDLHQESESAQHLAYLLKKKGLLNASAIGRSKACERPETVKLRFDNERAPFDWIPTDLRRLLIPIFLEHSEGALLRYGRRWQIFDPVNRPEMWAPYPFETHRIGDGSEQTQTGNDSPYLLSSWTWPVARDFLKYNDLALLPVGAIEQHGPHLPLDTDAFDANYLALQVAKLSCAPQPVVLPLISYGVSYHHEDFPGTLSIAPETLAQLVYEVGMGAARNGIQKLIIINGHGGNTPALHFAAQKINRDASIFTAVDSGETSDTDIDSIAETANDVHAGEIETSTALATRPDLVKLSEMKRFVPRFSSHYLNFSSRRGISWYAKIKKLSPTGVLGDPTLATAEKGKRMWDVMVRNLVELVGDLQGISLEELYQRRY